MSFIHPSLRRVCKPTRTYKIGVPPGVGDVYWCLTKIKDYRKQHKLKHVTLCVQKTHLTRALEWPKMTSGIIDAAIEFPFKSELAKETGFAANVPGVNCVMWPNAIVDQGKHLRTWLPNYEIDLNFEIKTAPAVPSVVVYASSEGVNKAWLPGRGPAFWNELLVELRKAFGITPTLIGAGWDVEFHKQITAPHHSLIGQTNLEQVAGVIKNASVLVGMISGMTILANHFNTPTIAMWPDHRFPEMFPFAWIRPGINYMAVPASMETSARDLAYDAERIAR
jgi:hypothetical protein